MHDFYISWYVFSGMFSILILSQSHNMQVNAFCLLIMTGKATRHNVSGDPS